MRSAISSRNCCESDFECCLKWSGHNESERERGRKVQSREEVGVNKGVEGRVIRWWFGRAGGRPGCCFAAWRVN